MAFPSSNKIADQFMIPMDWIQLLPLNQSLRHQFKFLHPFIAFQATL
jgi:hypothetical protein